MAGAAMAVTMPPSTTLTLWQASSRAGLTWFSAFKCRNALRMNARKPRIAVPEEDYRLAADARLEEALERLGEVSSEWNSDGEESEDSDELDEAEAGEEDALSERARKVDELCALYQENGGAPFTSRQLARLYNFRLDKFQRLAIQAFLKESSVVVSTPTSSGKTLVAEAAAAVVLAKGRRLFYTTPLKALSNQKFREFRSVFGEASVGLLTGDISINRDAPIVIMTAEILRNKLYLNAGNDEAETLVGVDVVVLDEIHYLSDVSRGTVWEETVIYCPKRIQLICLSATIANPEELAGWIEKVHGPTELITSSKRPVPLLWHISRRSGMLPLLNEQGTKLNRQLEINPKQLKRIKRKDSFEMRLPEDPLQVLQRLEVPRISDTLKQLVAHDMLPAIWFILSRKRCDEAVSYVNKAGLLSPEEIEKVDEALKAFRKLHPEGVRASAVASLYQGVAAHHAGCLPIWKGFIEELFQRGLVKVVFATETLAAGINMPARSTVLSSTTWKAGGQMELSSNSILQMAGRAGRRGIDTLGHVVLVQSPFRGPKDCYKMVRAGSDPVVSRFTANYGMALNLLAGSTGNVSTNELGDARRLIEQSFGNYIGSEILLGSKAKLIELQAEIESLENGYGTDSISRHYEEKLREYHDCTEKLKMRERKERSLQFKFEKLKSKVVQAQLNEHILPYVCLSFSNPETEEEATVSALYIGPENTTNRIDSEQQLGLPYLAFGGGKKYYRFSASAIKSVHRSGLTPETREQLRSSFQNDGKWEPLGEGVMLLEATSVTCDMDLPTPDQLPEEMEPPEELLSAERLLLVQRRAWVKLSTRMKEFDEKEMSELSTNLQRLREERIARLKAKSERITNRIKQMQPSGWNEFLEVVNVLKAANAMRRDSYELLPLGETARAIRGTNELWLAIALLDDGLASLRPPELAAVVAALVNENAKSRHEDVPSNWYKPSDAVMGLLQELEPRREWLISLQAEHNLDFPCDLNPQLSGFVEAWASGVSWKELDLEEIMDEGDLARLLRRTIDLLAQIPHLPHVEHALAKTAKDAANFLDRPPISEAVAE